MQCSWDSFISSLKEADSNLSQRLPSAANALDTMNSFMICDLKNLLAKASCGLFFDPSQDAREMVSKLKNTCAHVHSLSAKLEQLSRNSEDLQGIHYGYKYISRHPKLLCYLRTSEHPDPISILCSVAFH